MSQTYTAVNKHWGAWWIGWIEEVPGVNCQEPTREELLETLRITLEEALELDRREARGWAGQRFKEIPIAVSTRELCGILESTRKFKNRHRAWALSA